MAGTALGLGTPTAAADPGASPLGAAPLGDPRQLATDLAGNVYAADRDHGRVVRISPGGETSTVADGLDAPDGLAVDGAGTVYVADRAAGVSRITATGRSAVAPAPADAALAVDPGGNLYVADRDAGLVWRVTPAGVRSLVLGGGATPGPLTGPTPALDVRIDPSGVTVDGVGNLYAADRSACYVLKVDPAGTATTYAGRAAGCGAPPEAPARATSASVGRIGHLAADPAGNVYLADRSNRTVERVGPDGTLTVLAPSPLGPVSSVTAGPTGVVYFTADGDGSVSRLGPAAASPPRDLRATPRDRALALSFLPPLDPGLTPVTSYDVSLDGAQTWRTLSTTVSSGRLTGTVAGLRNGVQYSVLVAARNTAGRSPGSAIIPAVPGVPAPATAAARPLAAGRELDTPAAPAGAPHAPGHSLAVTGPATLALAGAGLALLITGARLAGVGRAGLRPGSGTPRCRRGAAAGPDPDTAPARRAG
ncbi:fibronectin type III domain-containing protein [Dactylosporangium sp. CA-139066]|uniref:fibronectin type III domain-containing protein n=1 Tax=Dactylosporangium sp. CA-139066 TaxID=3239930 RepID=UPI003D928B72